MPKHLAIDINVLSGTAVFNNVKSVNVSYGRTFDLLPIVNLSLNDTTSVPPYKMNVTNSGFTIMFQTKYTGSVDWNVIER